MYQYKQVADRDKPYKDIEEQRNNPVNTTSIPEEDKTSKEEGLNKSKSAGNAGAFEGFENQGGCLEPYIIIGTCIFYY